MKPQKKILVCIDEHPRTRVLLRAAVNKAEQLNCEWIALYVETADHYVLDKESQNNVLSAITLAEEMGAQVRQVEAKKVIDGITSFIGELANDNVELDTIIIGKSEKEGFFSELKTSNSERVYNNFHKQNINIQITPLSGKVYKQSWFEKVYSNELTYRGVILASLFVILAFIITELLRMGMDRFTWQDNIYNVTALFLISCVVSSLRYGLLAGLYSAVVSYFVVHYFYVKPLHDFGIDDASDGVSLTIFLASAVVVTFVGAMGKASNNALARKERRLQALYTLHRIISRTNDRKEALELLNVELEKMLEMKVAFFLNEPLSPRKLSLAFPSKLKISKSEWFLINKCWDEVRTTGVGTLVNTSGLNWRYEPLIGHHGEIGVLALEIPPYLKLDASFGRLLRALADQSALILERIELSEMMSESRVREEKEKLRALLLSSVSHDLKTPLASIIGAMSVYQRMEKNNILTPDDRKELIETTLEEAQRLDSFITNILDITRIESGEIRFNLNYEDPYLCVRSVIKRLRQRLKNREVNLNKTLENCEVLMDASLTEQVVQNILDNACKYSKAGAPIDVNFGEDDNGFFIKIRDYGEGIPEGKEHAIFDKYERLKSTDSSVAGTGLGLAICRAIMESQGGEVRVDNHKDGGAIFSIYFKQFKKTNDEAS